MKHIIKLIGAFALSAALHLASAHAGDLTVNGNLTVTTDSIVNGRVGIGTASPHVPLEIQSGFDAEVLRFGHNVSDYHSISTSFHGSQPQFNYLGFNLEYNSSDIRRVMTLVGNGNVGIGTTSPGAAMEISRNVGAGLGPVLRLNRSSAAGNQLFLSFADGDNDVAGIYAPAGSDDLRFNNGHADLMTIASAGNVGIGTIAPDAPLNIRGAQGYETIESDNNPNGSVLQLWNHTSGLNVSYGAINFGDGSTTPGQIAYGVNTGFAFRAGGNIQANLSEDGTFSVKVLQINGADVAEPFEVSSQSLPKGSVVVIDEDSPGKVKQSYRAYDKRVAGILSGANGVHPGIRLKQNGFNASGEDVALSGRAYTLADASCGAIKPGDLLTTSDTPGHCMKVADPARAQGAIIGKAMSSLESGKGMVLVLVSLQ